MLCVCVFVLFIALAITKPDCSPCPEAERILVQDRSTAKSFNYHRDSSVPTIHKEEGEIIHPFNA